MNFSPSFKSLEVRMKVLRSYWPVYAIVLILLLVVASPYIFKLCTSLVNNAILALTAAVVFWYTLETKRMKNEIAKQNLLQTRPILTINLRNRKPFARNEGRGPALNATVKNFSVRSAALNRVEFTEAMYDFHLPNFISVDSEHELVMYKKNGDSKGTVSEPEILFEIGKAIRITIQYEDIEGTAYETSMEIRSGITQKISIIKQGSVSNF
jgi:hypothetical protein